MPTREFSEEEKEEAKDSGESFKEECEHSKVSGECLKYNEMCYFENQEECPRYSPKYK